LDGPAEKQTGGETMRLRNFVGRRAALATAILFAGAVSAFAADDTEVKAIERVERGFGAATKYEQAARFFAPDAALLDVFTPGYAVGPEEIRKSLEWQFASIKSIDNSFNELSIMRSGDLACTASIQHSVVQNPGRTDDVTFVWLDGLRKTNGRWDIVHYHAAFPLDPKTFENLANRPVTEQRATVVHESDWFSGPAIPKAQAEAELRKWADGLYEAQNPEEAIKYYDDDATMYAGPMPMVRRGRAEILQRIRDDFSGLKSLRAKIRHSGVITDGVLGIVWSLQDLDIVTKDGRSAKMNIRQTDCLRRKGGKWLAVQEIWSYPIDPHTWKGVPVLQYSSGDSTAGAAK